MSTVTVTNVDQLNAALTAADQAVSGRQTIVIDGDIALGGTALEAINLQSGVTLTIQGENGAIIDGGGTQQWLFVYSGVVTIEGLTIEASVTLASLAEKLGRPQSFVAKYESRERRLDVAEFIGIARAIGADPLKMLRVEECDQN